MTSRERMRTILNFGIPDRIGILDAPWPETVARWHREGLPPSVSPHEYFDFDVDYCLYLDTSFMLPRRLLENGPDAVVFSDEWGAVKKYWRSRTGTPLTLDYPVKTQEDWLALKPLLKPGLDRFRAGRWGDYSLPEERILNPSATSWEDALDKCRNARERDKFVFLSVSGPFETLGNLLPHEDMYIAMAESPGLFHDIFGTLTDMVVASFQLLPASGAEVDGIFFTDDIAYKNGMLVSPKMCRELLLPYYRRICSFFNDKGAPVIFHCDGNLDEALPLLLDAGITAIEPMEVRAGNDVRKIKQAYGDRLVLMGNISVAALSGTLEDIENEVSSRVLAAKENGGYIYHSDHSVPPSVSFQNFGYAIALAKEYGTY